MDWQFAPPTGTEILHMPREASAHHVVVALRSTMPTDMVCPYCGGDRFKNGTRLVRFRDIPGQGQPVFIDWTRQKFICRACGRSSHDQHPAFDSRRDMTVRFIEWIAKEASQKGFVAVAKETSIDRKVARRAFREAEKKLGARVDLLSDTIAIELIDLAGRDRPAIIDVRSEFVFDVYASSEDLRKRLPLFAKEYSKLHERALISVDISLTIAQAGSHAIPRDLFGRHVQRVISRSSLEREVVGRIVTACEPLFGDLHHRAGQSPQFARVLFCRRSGSMKKTANRRLESWKRIAPDLYSAYLHKEAFLNIWQADVRASREDNLTKWINDVAGQSNLQLKPIVDLVESRSSEILNYGNHRSLNDFHERLGGIVALNKDRTARSFAAARAALRAQGLSHQEAQLAEFLKNVGP